MGRAQRKTSGAGNPFDAVMGSSRGRPRAGDLQDADAQVRQSAYEALLWDAESGPIDEALLAVCGRYGDLDALVDSPLFLTAKLVQRMWTDALLELKGANEPDIATGARDRLEELRDSAEFPRPAVVAFTEVQAIASQDASLTGAQIAAKAREVYLANAQLFIQDEGFFAESNLEKRWDRLALEREMLRRALAITPAKA